MIVVVVVAVTAVVIVVVVLAKVLFINLAKFPITKLLYSDCR